MQSWRRTTIGSGRSSPPWAGQDIDLLWAGYSDLQSRMDSFESKNRELKNQVAGLVEKVEAAPAKGQVQALLSLGFLIFFTGFINWLGFMVKFNTGVLLPSSAGRELALAFKHVFAVLVPSCNLLTTLVICVHAVRSMIRLVMG